MTNIPKYKFSGHQSFPFRYTWLPKAFRALNENLSALADEDQAMVTLGVGKNMVHSIRFWVQVADIAKPSKNREYLITDFGKAMLSESGFDPYLEDIQTLWLIHWNISTNINEPPFAWDYLLNRWQHPEITRAEVLQVFQKESELLNRKFSPVTLGEHFDIFLHTYVPTQSSKGNIQEDNLDCPLVELELIQCIGERKVGEKGKREAIYAFRREDKLEISPELFIYCLNDFWNNRRPNEKTLSFRDVSIAHGSPGQIFKIPEINIRERLETIEKDSGGVFTFKESASLQQIIRNKKAPRDFLSNIYAIENAYA